MPQAWRRTVWIERIVAIVLALLALAVLYPNLGSFKRLPNGREVWKSGDPRTLAIFVAVELVLLVAIIVGQRRSRVLRIVGWILLLALCTLEFRVW